jgi:hypothetical protein
MSDNNPKAKKVIPIIPQPGYDPAAKAAGKDEKLVSLYAGTKKSTRAASPACSTTGAGPWW